MNKKKNLTLTGCAAAISGCTLIILICLIFLITRASGEKYNTPEQESAGSGLFSIFSTFGMKNAEPPESVVVSYMQRLDLDESGNRCLITTDGSRMYIDRPPVSSEGQLLYSLLQNSWSWKMDPAVVNGTTASVNVYITCPDTSSMVTPLQQEMQRLLSSKVSSAQRREDVYNEDHTIRSEVLDDIFWSALGAVSAEAKETCSVTVQTVLSLTYAKREWHVSNSAQLVQTLDERVQQMKQTANQGLTYVPKVYTIDETATEGPRPEPTAFGSTEDPAVVSALLERFEAKNLIQGQSLCWNENVDCIPGTAIRYYLDESILMIQWQEKEAGMVGTFSEVFILDGSQLRRKIAGNTFGDMNFRLATEFAEETNAVLAVGGDFYNHARNCGIVVYNREIFRFDPVTCDTCYITASGDLLFSYRSQFSTREEAQQFVRDNDVLYSLCFGPVMIDNGQDVTPSEYAWGEIRDTYARAALGMLGEHHYLTMNLNCGTGEYYNYATLRQAADAMVAKGCIKAYTLDGGQTCTTVVNGELINPVQFGWEKAVSDIIYFSTAIPNA